MNTVTVIDLFDYQVTFVDRTVGDVGMADACNTLGSICVVFVLLTEKICILLSAFFQFIIYLTDKSFFGCDIHLYN